MCSLLKVLGFAVVLFAFPLLGMAQAPVPDMILTGGKIVTLDARDTLAEALAINHGRISFVGSAAQIRALAGPQTVVVDLAGRTPYAAIAGAVRSVTGPGHDQED